MQLLLGFTVLGMPLISAPLLQQWFHAAILPLHAVSSGVSKHVMISKQLLDGPVLRVNKDRGLPEQTWVTEMTEAWSV